MEEKIIPEKELLFQPKFQKRPTQPKPPVRPAQPAKKAVQQEKLREEEKPIFNIPQLKIQQQVQESVSELPLISEPKGKSQWRKWVIIAAVAIIVIGLGIYFLFV